MLKCYDEEAELIEAKLSLSDLLSGVPFCAVVTPPIPPENTHPFIHPHGRSTQHPIIVPPGAT